MKFKPIFSVVLPICGVLVACGGGEKPAVEPAPVAAPVVADSSKPDLSNAVDRYSYALGMDLGKAVANVNVPLNIPVLMGAIKDQVDSNRSVLMSDSASESALQDLLLQMQKKKEADDKAQAQKALDEQTKFFAENAKDTTVKKTPKGVQYKMLKAGAGISPKTGDKVQVHYVGSLLDGTEFDNSVKRGEPLEFPVDAVIEGWQDLLQVMKEGDKVKAWIPSALAYGEAGVPPMIPANAMLVFEVELLKVFAEVPAIDSAAVAPVAPAAEPAKAEAKPAEKKAEAKPAEKKPEAKSAEAVKPAAKPAEQKSAEKPAAKK
ncbi:MAG: FKBP-type peptidyl-prolyl cis-trans isomerase [Fibrobacter sp.]|jgi:FKBP-type peptidyl-prolyl cis-trans isomerase|nr:FKBP-type peptidyl-prolyl cis-trans isomerase [Fibrobacter sp.]